MEETHNRDQEFLDSLIEIVNSNLPDENFGAGDLAQKKRHEPA